MMMNSSDIVSGLQAKADAMIEKGRRNGCEHSKYPQVVHPDEIGILGQYWPNRIQQSIVHCGNCNAVLKARYEDISV